MTLKIGLTGGIGSGKSTAAKYFAQFKIPIIDADVIVHKLLESHTSIYKKIINHFGRDILTVQKNLNKKGLRAKIFSNPKERVWLEKLLHPQVRNVMLRQTAGLKDPYCIMVIPLFFETKFPVKVDRILVIDCPQKVQMQRLQKRGVTNIQQIRRILRIQASRSLRLKNADDIINNISTLIHLRKEVEKLHYYYLSLA
ncbi:MAG: dephospho-CoA kinase [Coxiellaceae bacterium]|jgi:dephospho-CoA kinase|nr:dephospho-CoA kinase [Coxiellaceae bacterium]